MKLRKKTDRKRYDVIRPMVSITQVPKPRAAKAPKPKKPETKKKPEPAPVKRFSLLALYKKLFASVVFGRLYAMIAVAVLAATTLLWAVLGARLHDNNADQLVDPYLFQNHTVLQQADFPGTHTFLLKWPLFWLIRLADYSNRAYIAVTVGAVILTVTALVIILYRIERRPAVFGTLCLALASTLLLVPAMPYAGGLLPVNMAMLATRNLEYVLYIGALIFVLRAKRVRSVYFGLACAGLIVLMASDKLFLVLSLGAAAIMLFVYALRQRPQLIHMAARWLLAGLLAAIGSAVVVAVINLNNFATISGGTDSSPYGVVHSSHDILLGVLYGGTGLLTNFGANPAYDATVIADIPHQVVARLASLSGPSYVVNLLIFGIMLAAAGSVLYSSLRKPKRTDKKFDTAHALSLALLFGTIVALGVFVATSHYFAVDARYLTISVFALFITAATFARQFTLRRNYTIIAGAVVLTSIFLGIPGALNSFADDRAALTEINERNGLVVQALGYHKVDALVGDYWRVIPARHVARDKLNVVPLSNCAQIRDTLTSKAWHIDMQKQSFAYLLSMDKSLTDFPNCSLKQVVAAYGHPNSSLLVAGTFASPKEELLFYDHGIQPAAPNQSAEESVQSLASITPIAPSELPDTTCDGPAIMNIVAHQDDDLLFQSPDLLHDVKAGNCVRTVYITAGDAGHDQFYWLSRQQGSEAAYSNMLGFDHGWVQRIVRLSKNAYVTVASPRDDPKISLIFMNLPDGDTDGYGFHATNYESLAQLETGDIRSIHAVDHQSSYTSAQLSNALLTLMDTFQPTEIRTLATVNMSDEFPDHSDHLAAGRYTQGAYQRYQAVVSPDVIPPPIYYYIGYPIHALDANVADPDLSQKEAAFFTYAAHDGSVCKSMEACAERGSTYSLYLARQYQQP
jgi:LmbE family N-acetylglucosaminyl deacetylase